ncbi:ArpU family phage packaging/lysis transcriptional regulator [Furfurilactobacillus curtus]|uniref:ArpU family transcriptional regulator n=1 Tax=Furfurilactobacillus curtus TaxID=1746200 RepID=A0ABQ5JK99_9LACO
MNEDAVINEAKKELSRCGRLMRQAGKRMSELKSPVFDAQPKAPSFANSVESRMVKQIDAENELRDILLAISLCDNKSKQILFDLYVDPNEYSDLEAMDRLGYQSTQYFHYKHRALLRFAEGYKQGAIYEQLQNSGLLAKY